jgi:translation initiation factor IF-3
VDLVEIAPNANPPVCRLVDFGKFRYEQAKKEKESKKHQHATRVKEVQLSAKIDPHDLSVKIEHGVDFLCEDMKVKITLKFRGREMAHTEFGFQVINKFITEVAPYGHPDFQPKLIGRSINVMISPLPRNKRAKNPRQVELPPEEDEEASDEEDGDPNDDRDATHKPQIPIRQPGANKTTSQAQAPAPATGGGGFSNNPFAQINVKPD